jgi:glutamate--cysteine ligase catalytic subunit
MDAMAFGMGCSCLQITYETTSIKHARYLHDAFLPFTPILAALSASAPIFKGKLADIDLRWTVIS